MSHIVGGVGSANNPRQRGIFCFAALKTQNMPLLGGVEAVEKLQK